MLLLQRRICPCASPRPARTPATGTVGARPADAGTPHAPRHECLVGGRGPRPPAQGPRPGHESANRGPLAAPRRAPAPARPRPGCAPRRAAPQGASGAHRLHADDDDPDAPAWRHPLVAPHRGSAPADESYVRAAGLDRPGVAPPPASGPSRSARPRPSRTSWRMWWAGLCTRPNMPWFSAWRRTARSKRWIAPSPAYP